MADLKCSLHVVPSAERCVRAEPAGITASQAYIGRTSVIISDHRIKKRPCLAAPFNKEHWEHIMASVNPVPHSETQRQVARIVRGLPTSDGAGVKLTRVIGQP